MREKHKIEAEKQKLTPKISTKPRKRRRRTGEGGEKK